MKTIERMQKTLHRLHLELPLRIDVMDQKGVVVASTHAGRIGMQGAGGGCVRLPLAGQMTLAVEGEGPMAENAARLVAMLLADQGKAPKENGQETLYALLMGESAGAEAMAIGRYLPARVILIRVGAPRAEAVSSMVGKAFPEPDQCLSCVMDSHTVALIVPEAEQDREDFVQLAQAILDTMENELDADGTAGVSASAKAIADIPEAYKQAGCALKTGASQSGRRPIRVYDDMILERMVHSLAGDVRRSLIARLSDDTGKSLLDEEMAHTADVFLDSGLNLSETARRLYIHRNTLIYRLDKIQKQLGLDIRDFHEATVYRVLTMASHIDQEDDAT